MVQIRSIFLVPLLLISFNADATRLFDGSVTLDAVRIRTTPSFSGEVFSKRVSKGERLKLKTSKYSAWFEILSPEELIGKFIHQSVVAVKPEVALESNPPQMIAESLVVRDIENPFDFNSYYVSALVAIDTAGYIMSGIFGWTPSYLINEKLRIGVNLGAAVFRNVNSDYFLVGEYSGFGEYQIDSVYFVNLQVGAQSWFSSKYGTYPLVGAGVAYQFLEPILGCGKRLLFSYTPVLMSNNFVHELKLGLGFQF